MSDRKSRSNPVQRDAADEAYEDPYSPSSPDYAERHKVTRYEIFPGIFREDIGVPA